MQTGYHTRCLLCVPVKSRGVVVGVIQLINKTHGEFGPDDETLAKLMATQIAGFVRNLEQFQSASEQHERVSEQLLAVRRELEEQSVASATLQTDRYITKLLLNFAGVAAAVNDLPSLAAIVERHVPHILDGEAAVLYLLDHDTGEMWCAGRAGTSVDGGVRLARGQGFAGYIAQTRDVLCIANAGDDPRLDVREEARLGIRLGALVAAPIVDTDGTLIGVVEVQ
jgi:GAF domain-containing protein